MKKNSLFKGTKKDEFENKNVRSVKQSLKWGKEEFKELIGSLRSGFKVTKSVSDLNQERALKNSSVLEFEHLN